MKETDKRELFEKMPVGKAVRTLAVPTIFGQLIVLIYNMADTFFIGRTNNPFMVAGASLILPVFNISLSIAAIAGIGGGSLISRLLGEYRDDDAKKVCNFSLWLTIALSLIFSLTAFFFMRPLLNILGADADTFEFARTYAMCVVVFGGLPTIMTNVLSSLVRSIGESGKAGFGVMLGGVINIILDPLFMFVLLPKGNEILGAGVATCLSNCISCLYFIVMIIKLRKKSVLSFGMPNLLPDQSNIAGVFIIGLPSALATLLFDVDYIVIDKLMSGYSAIALAAIGIVLKVERLPLNIGVGICQAMVPIVAYNYAAKNYQRLKSVERYFLYLGIICAIVSIILYEIFAPYFIRFFINEPNTVALGTDFLRARCLATVFMFMSFYHVNLFNGYGQGFQATFLGITRWLVLNIPMLFILNAIFGMYGIVWSQLISDVMMTIISVVVHRWFIKKQHLL